MPIKPLDDLHRLNGAAFVLGFLERELEIAKQGKQNNVTFTFETIVELIRKLEGK